MRRFRFTVSGLSTAVVLSAFIFAAVRSPTEPWSTGAFSLALLVLGVAVLGAIFRRGPARAYWTGFSLLGWGYMVLVFGPWFDTHIAPLLFTRMAFERLHFGYGQLMPGQTYMRPIGSGSLVMFGYQQMGHSLTAVLLGLLGGVLARRFATMDGDPAASAEPLPGPRPGSPAEAPGQSWA